MSYVLRSLAPGERVRLQARMHWILWLRAWLALVFLGVVVIGIVMFVRDAMVLMTTEIAITSRRIILKRGWISRHSAELEMTSVEAVNVDQDIWGRIFGFGRVEVHGTGDDVWTSPLIAAPVRFRRELEAALSARRD